MQTTDTINIKLPAGKKAFFASDNHLGAPTQALSRPRERTFVDWLNHIQKEAAVIFLLGDLFDFWFEYKTVVPKGFVRVLGKLAELSDSGIPIHFFTGNHDLWMHSYFEEELGVTVHHQPVDFTIENNTLLVGHGDGLGPGDKGYKRMKKVFRNGFMQWGFRWLHPDIGMRLGHYLSVKNKLISGKEDAFFLGNEEEWLVQYSQRKRSQKHRDYFVFGHRHLPLEIPLATNSKYVNTGDWIHHYTYGVFDGKTFDLKKWKAPHHD